MQSTASSLQRPISIPVAWGPVRRRPLIDAVLALAVLVAVAPLLALIALAIKLEAPFAPALFSQERTGLHGRRFRMLKFRTMVLDAEALKPMLVQRSLVAWPDFRVADDPRITRVGYWLRRFALDELPNLVNVVRGEMRLVGPRPTSFSVQTYEPWQRSRLAVLPGVTGLWQISPNRDEGFDARVRQDLEYEQKRGCGSDLCVVVMTLPAVLRRRTAY